MQTWGWLGNPQVIRIDQGGELWNSLFSEWCNRNHILIDPIPREAHWANGVVERHIQIIKNLLPAEPTGNVHDAIMQNIQACMVKNFTINHLGFSPFQRVFGHNPLIGGLQDEDTSMWDPVTKDDGSFPCRCEDDFKH